MMRTGDIAGPWARASPSGATAFAFEHALVKTQR